MFANISNIENPADSRLTLSFPSLRTSFDDLHHILSVKPFDENKLPPTYTGTAGLDEMNEKIKISNQSQSFTEGEW